MREDVDRFDRSGEVSLVSRRPMIAQDSQAFEAGNGDDDFNRWDHRQRIINARRIPIVKTRCRERARY